jgi:peptide/nickel transport system substrate-binding protein/oligopeptide transport system substrate-binding protein
MSKFTSFRTTRRNFLGTAAGLGAAGAVLGATGQAWAAPGFRSRAALANAQEGAIFRMFYPNFPTLDPQVVTNGMWFDAEGLLEGLVTLAEGGTEAVAAAAESWEVAEDGLSYTFTLRDAQWSNGDPVTAQDFEWTYKRLLTAQGSSTGVTLGANSYQPILQITGAVDHLNGVISDFAEVGIKAIDEKTLEFSLDTANAEFPMLLTHPSMLPLHPASVEASEDWIQPANWVGNGAFVPTEWTVNTKIVLAPNENYWDAANVTLTGMEVQLVEGANAQAAAAYEAGEVDLTGLQVADLIRYQADPTLAEQLHAATGGSVGYLATLRSKNPILEDVNIRKALSLSLDRETVAIANPSTRPGPQLVPDSLANWSEEDNTPYDVDQAKQILADAGYPDGEGFPELRILFGGTQTNVQLEALADTWQKNLGITVSLDMQEAGVYVERRWAVQEEDYIGFYFGTFGSTPTWSTWAANLWGPQFIQEFSLKSADWAEYQTIQNDQALEPADKAAQLQEIRDTRSSEGALNFVAAVEEAFTLPDPAEQQAALQDAAKIRQETYLIIPMYYADLYYAIKPEVSGVNLIPGGLHFYYKTITKEG